MKLSILERKFSAEKIASQKMDLFIFGEKEKKILLRIFLLKGIMNVGNQKCRRRFPGFVVRARPKVHFWEEKR